MKKCLMLMSNGFEEAEAVAVIDVLRRCGLELDTCSITGNCELESARGIKIRTDKKLSELIFNEYDAVIFPGGSQNANSLEDSEKVIEIVRDFNSKNFLIAAICAAPGVLKKAGILKGKNATSYPGILSKSDCIYSEKSVVKDGNMITSRGAATAFEFAFGIAEYLGMAEIADKVRKDMLF
ncbi:MAG: DJ-1/PfpI family protein [Clostridiales bacterium]|jgi:4-methyl-5(b-hydroxyethyl)-thiazole monophosphate biosynthesis|nr:DJ-1/PfpI family protein [Clostridiales bacterium]